MWLKAFAARARDENKRNIDETPGASGPSAIVAEVKDFQPTDFSPSQCSLEALIMISVLVARAY